MDRATVHALAKPVGSTTPILAVSRPRDGALQPAGTEALPQDGPSVGHPADEGGGRGPWGWHAPLLHG